MYIRSVTTRAKGISYKVQRLVESYKTKDGKVRQRVIMNLGNIEEDIPKDRWKELATLLELRISGQQTFISYSEEINDYADQLYAKNLYSKSKPEIIENKEANESFDTIDINSIQVGEARQLGPELVAYHTWHELKLEQLLESIGFTANEISTAMALIIGRLISPGSELETHRWFQNRTALIEMTPSDIGGIGKDIFYTTGDLLYENKDIIETTLYERETTLFSLKRKLFLFDLTNTYFEGNAKANEFAKYGKSKEKRTDCPLVSLALMVDEEGFPIYSEIHKGNISEPSTLEKIMDEVCKRDSYFMEDPIFIMDRGIATNDNIKLLQKRNCKYLLISRADKAKAYEDDFKQLKEGLDQEGFDLGKLKWTQFSDEKEIYIKCCQSSPEEKRVLVLSIDRESKEIAMDRKKEERFKAEIVKIQASIEKGSLKLTDAAALRVGKLYQKYFGISAFYEPIITPDEEDPKKIKSVSIIEAKSKKTRPIVAGTYVIETNQVNLSTNEIWETYHTLTKVEAAFCDLKSDLGLRPVYHTTSERTCAHLFIGVLAYHLLVSIEHQLRNANDTRSWKTIKDLLSTHQRTTVRFVNKMKTIIHLRLSTNPESSHIEIYKKLSVKDPLKKIRTEVKGNE